MLFDIKNGQGSVILRVKLRRLDTSQGLTGLTSASGGLIISAIADNESSPTSYTAAGSTIETIATLGTFAAPTASKCRFAEVSSGSHPGIYELQIADARFGVASAKSLLVSLGGATNLAECDFLVPLRTVDPYVAGGRLPVDLQTIKTQAVIAASGVTILASVGTAATATAQTGDSFARLGAPAGASHAADVAAVKAKTDLLVELNVNGTVVDASPAVSSFKGDAGLSSIDGFYTGGWLAFTAGSLKGLSHKVTGYTGSTRLFAFGGAFPAAPANGDAFTLLGGTS